MKKEHTYVITKEDGDVMEIDSISYLNYILRMIKNTPNDMELGNKLRKEYETLRMSLIILFNDDIEDNEEIPY